jgi:electron transfer flavoprotein alpha subunit
VSLLVVIEHDRGALASASLEALTFGRGLAAQMGTSMEAVIVGDSGAALAGDAAAYGASASHVLTNDMFTDYSPEAWGAAVASLLTLSGASALLACGTDRGNEILAQVAARLDLPFVANCADITVGNDWSMTRVRWGGSLLEEATLAAPTKLVSVGHHSCDAEAANAPAPVSVNTIAVDIDPTLGRTLVRDRVIRSAGVTLTTAPVVVSGGRGVGSPEGFAPLEELAGLLGGVVGCSRAVTNNGWRNHTDQVGQTGNRIAPDIYIACGISGAIQHWVGAMASKKILAINTDKEANMVVKADYAVIGDLHKVIPAISEEVRRRRG